MSQRDWLPNLFVAGAPKSGTSSVHQWIADHPDAVGSLKKETYFFVDPGTHMYSPKNHVSNGVDTFRENFPEVKKSTKVIVESTPGYIYYETALAKIPYLESSPKCLFIVREPSAQVYSAFQYFKNNWNWIPYDTTFEGFICEVKSGTAKYRGNELAENAIKFAQYVDYLVKWRDRLGPDRIMVKTFDQLMSCNRSFTQEVATWCGLNAEFYDEYTFPRQNETYTPKNKSLQKLNVLVRNRIPKGRIYERAREIYRGLNTTKPEDKSDEDQATISYLRNYFRSSNERLSTEFNLDLSEWL